MTSTAVEMSHILRYVDDVDAALTFYTAALGLERRFLHEGGDYGEVSTGTTTLAFAENALIESHGIDFRARGPRGSAGATGRINHDATEVAFECVDIQATFDAAITAGAVALKSPTKMPWGQSIAYLADPWGHLIGLGQWHKEPQS